MTREEIRTALTGPMASLRTPFQRDGRIDYGGVRSVIDFSMQAGSRVTLITAGDSHLICMSDSEIAELTRVAVEHTAGRAMVVAADWEFGTGQAVEFAITCKAMGVDVYMVRPPDWAASATAEGLVNHYTAVAQHIPVMMVTNVFQDRGMPFGLQVIQAVRDRVDQVVALKEDLSPDFARQVCLSVRDRWAMFSGGGLRNHLNLWPYGCVGFMDRFMNFKPEVSHRYWQALQRNDLAAAVSVIRDVELPLETFLNGFPGGRDAAIHGLMEIYGICGRWRRPPYHSLTDHEMEKLRGFVREMGLL
ncbi:MAG: dihydrodipicolinate synthase family protein [Planctomycetes bacterium]|nr:dihydrodipicolinate synthase family protein [Planctomycetota bacterium]